MTVLYPALFLVLLSALRSQAASLTETWESRDLTNPFTGQGDRTWTGDVGGFQIANASWPTGEDLMGSRSLHALTSATAVNHTVVTSLDSVYSANLSTLWTVYVSGNSAAITSGLTFSWILMADTNDVAAIEAGTMNGYRLRLAGSTDALRLEKASGGGWVELHSTAVGTANLNSGWNLAARRTEAGLWSYGYATGPAGTEVLWTDAATDLTTLTGLFTGMNWTSPAGDSGDFGFDNFAVTSTVPEPSTLLGVVAGLGLVGILGHPARRARSTRF